MAKKVAEMGIRREPGYEYFLKDGSVWRTKMKRPGTSKGQPERVCDVPLTFDSSYKYFIDKEGDISRSKKAPVPGAFAPEPGPVAATGHLLMTSQPARASEPENAGRPSRAARSTALAPPPPPSSMGERQLGSRPVVPTPPSEASVLGPPPSHAPPSLGDVAAEVGGVAGPSEKEASMRLSISEVMLSDGRVVAYADVGSEWATLSGDQWHESIAKAVEHLPSRVQALILFDASDEAEHGTIEHSPLVGVLLVAKPTGFDQMSDAARADLIAEILVSNGFDSQCFEDEPLREAIREEVRAGLEPLRALAATVEEAMLAVRRTAEKVTRVGRKTAG